MTETVSKSSIGTYTGKRIDPLNPDPEQIDIVDIAHALSNQCRFTGHTNKFYSVAEHSVRVARLVADKHSTNNALILSALLHDAHEAYLMDLPKPLKEDPIFGQKHKEAELDLDRAIREEFKIMYQTWTAPIIKEADLVMLATEIEYLMPAVKEWWSVDNPDIHSLTSHGFTAVGWEPSRAKKEFLNYYSDLSGESYFWSQEDLQEEDSVQEALFKQGKYVLDDNLKPTFVDTPDCEWPPDDIRLKELSPPREESHPNSARFHELLREIGETHDKKQLDYGSGDDPFANVNASMDFGIPGWKGALLRANDKWARIKSYIENGTLANEGVEDSFRDIAVYVLIAWVLWEQEENIRRQHG